MYVDHIYSCFFFAGGDFIDELVITELLEIQSLKVVNISTGSQYGEVFHPQ